MMKPDSTTSSEPCRHADMIRPGRLAGKADIGVEYDPQRLAHDSPGTGIMPCPTVLGDGRLDFRDAFGLADPGKTRFDPLT